MKRHIGLVMAALTLLGLLSSCTANDGKVEPQAVSERYIESDITPNKDVCIGMYSRQNGLIDYLTQTQWSYADNMVSILDLGVRHYTISSNGIIEQQDNSWLNELDAIYPAQDDISNSLSIYMHNGDLYILVTQKILPAMSADGNTHIIDTGIYHVSESGLNQIDITLPMVQSELGDDMALNIKHKWNDYFIFGIDGSTDWFLYNSLENTFEKHSSDMLPYSFMLGDTLYMPSGNDGRTTLEGYSLPEYKQASSVNAAGYIMYPMNVDDGFLALEQLYDGDSRYRISQHTFDGKEKIFVLESKGYLLDSPDVYVQYLLVNQEGQIFVSVTTNNGSRLYAYDYQDNIVVNSDTIQVYSLYDSPTVRYALGIWNSSHPENPIEYTVGVLNDDISLSADDAIRNLNIELLAGNGPDIIILDGLPIDNMIDKGFLADLSQEVDFEDIFNNAATAFSREDAVYAIPARFSVNLIGGRQTTGVNQFDSLDQLATYIETTQPINNDIFVTMQNDPTSGYRDLHETAVYFDSSDAVFDFLYPTWSTEIWSNGHLNEEILLEFFYQSGRIVAHNDLLSGSAQNQTPAGNNSGSNFVTYQTLLFCEKINSIGNLPIYFDDYRNRAGDTTGEYGILSGPDSQQYFEANCVAALRTGGDVAGAEFIQTLLSLQVQKEDLRDGLPVNKSAFETELDEAERLNGTTVLTDLASLFETLSPVSLQTIPTEATKEAAIQYYDGQITAEEAVKLVKTATELWVAEQT